MNILAYQQSIAERLNADETLLQGGCRAFAEDSLDLYFEAARHVETEGGVALVVSTPAGELLEEDENGALSFELSSLEIVATEKPGVNRTREGAMTALAAALRAGRLLHGPTFQFLRFRQEAQEEAGVLSAVATFATTATLTLT